VTQIIVHSVLILALVVSYTVVTVTGNDGTGILAILAGYVGGSTATFMAARANGGINGR